MSPGYAPIEVAQEAERRAQAKRQREAALAPPAPPPPPPLPPSVLPPTIEELQARGPQDGEPSLLPTVDGILRRPGFASERPTFEPPAPTRLTPEQQRTRVAGEQQDYGQVVLLPAPPHPRACSSPAPPPCRPSPRSPSGLRDGLRTCRPSCPTCLPARVFRGPSRSWSRRYSSGRCRPSGRCRVSLRAAGRAAVPRAGHQPTGGWGGAVGRRGRAAGAASALVHPDRPGRVPLLRHESREGRRRQPRVRGHDGRADRLRL